MKGLSLLLVVNAAFVQASTLVDIEPRQSAAQTAYVNLALTRGEPQHVASGFIYGIPDNYPNQIPSHWYTDIGIRFCKGGGAQLGNVGSRGWIIGLNDYKGRFVSTLDNYKTCIAVKGDFSIYVHDLWGTDHSNSSTKWPGDNGDWSDYDKFVQQLMADISENMDPSHVTWDIWNEPDISIFWKRSTQQWVDMYVRTHKLIRSNSKLNSMKISGPSMAFRPIASNSWWTTWLRQVAGNSTVPDLYSYHLEGGASDVDNDPQYTNSSLRGLLKQYGLPERQVFANEYAESSEMVPGGYIWWISRLERYDFWGMLGNWLGGTQLHDLFGGLLTKKSNPGNYAATDYAAAPGFLVYSYYNLNMTGVRANTTGSTDRWLDTYATKGTDKVRILAGLKLQTGTYSVVVQGLSAVGYSSGSVTVSTYSFDGASTRVIASGPNAKGSATYSIVNDAITIQIHQDTSSTGWAFEFPVKAA